MPKLIIHDFFSKIKSFFSLKKRLGLTDSKTLKMDNECLEVDVAKLSFLLSSADITNTTGKLTVSSDFDDEKTEMFDVICAISIIKDEEVLKLCKTIRRVTFYRNSKGRLVNVTMGPPKVSLEEINHS